MSGIMSLFYLWQHTDAVRPPNRVPEHHFPKYFVKLTNSKEAENYSLGRLFQFVCFYQLNTIYYIIFTPKSLSQRTGCTKKKNVWHESGWCEPMLEACEQNVNVYSEVRKQRSEVTWTSRPHTFQYLAKLAPVCMLGISYTLLFSFEWTEINCFDTWKHPCWVCELYNDCV